MPECESSHKIGPESRHFEDIFFLQNGQNSRRQFASRHGAAHHDSFVAVGSIVYKTHWGHKLLFSHIGCEAYIQIWLFYIISGHNVERFGSWGEGGVPAASPAALGADDIKAHLFVALLLIPPAILLEALICRTIISKIILKVPGAFETESLSDRLTIARGRATTSTSIHEQNWNIFHCALKRSHMRKPYRTMLCN